MFIVFCVIIYYFCGYFVMGVVDGAKPYKYNIKFTHTQKKTENMKKLNIQHIRIERNI